jgi:hypothetical protein
MALLHEALVRAIRNKRTDKGRVDAILKILGLAKDDVIVSRDDLYQVLDYAAEAEITMEDQLGTRMPQGYSQERYEKSDDAWRRLCKIAGINWEDTP